MAKKMSRYLSEILEEYQKITKKTYTEMSLEFDITLSNLYLYRNEQGNPTARTIDKIIQQIEETCPEALKEKEMPGRDHHESAETGRSI